MEEKPFFFLEEEEKVFPLSTFLIRYCDRKQKGDRQEVASSAAVTTELKADLLLMLKAAREKKTTEKREAGAFEHGLQHFCQPG